MTTDPAGLQQLQDMVQRIISIFVAISFIALVIVLVVAGFKFLTSGGEPKTLQSAQQALTWAILGILFLVIAWLILQLIKAFTGVDVTTFNLGILCSGTDLSRCSPIRSP